MKDEADLPTTVEIKNVKRIFAKKVKPLGNSAYVSLPRRFVGKKVLVILTKGKQIRAKKMVTA